MKDSGPMVPLERLVAEVHRADLARHTLLQVLDVVAGSTGLKERRVLKIVTKALREIEGDICGIV